MKKYNHTIPSIQDKVKDMPHVYYFNLDSDADRREYMEDQFSRYGIDYTRVSQSKYLKNEFESWSHLLDDPSSVKNLNELYPTNIYAHIAGTLRHFDLFKKWYNNTNDEYLIVMEDDYDLSLIEYWHFTWNYFMNNIPYDWDAIQMSFESSNLLPMFLHPRDFYTTGFGAMLLNRNYVKKLLSISFNNHNQFITKPVTKIALASLSPKMLYKTCSVDTCIGGTGITYRIPIFTLNFDFCRSGVKFIETMHKYSEIAVKEWWKNERDNFSLEDFFTYDKPNDADMIKQFIYEK